MKNLKSYLIPAFCMILLGSCFTDREIKFQKSQIEFDNAVLLSRATGDLFPVIGLTRTSGTPSQQVNLVGVQLITAQPLGFSIEDVPSSYLNATTIKAVQGVHYTLNGNVFSMVEKVSKTNFTGLTINNGFPAQAGMSALVIVRLDQSGDLTPSENYRRIMFKISLN